MSTRLVLVRHGHVEGDFADRYLGRTDPGLSETGRRQAECLEQLEGVAGVPVWSSPSRRAMDTARLAFPDATITPQPLAAELSFGALDGLLPAEAERLFPEAAAYLASHPLDARPSGGEDWSALLARAISLRASIEMAGSLILVGHLFSLSALVAELTAADGRSTPLVLRLGCCEGLTLTRPGDNGAWTIESRIHG